MASDHTDMNDLARVAGTQAVRAAVDAAKLPSKGGKGKANARKTKPPEPGPIADDEELGTTDPRDRFTVDDEGLFYRPPGEDDATRRRVADPLRVLAFARDGQSNGWSLLTEFKNQDGEPRRHLIPLMALAGDGSEWRRGLLGAGFIVPTDTNRRRWFTDYLVSRRPSTRVRLVHRPGWHGSKMVTPSSVIGDGGGEALMLYTDGPLDEVMSQAGDLDQWQQEVSALCVGNSRLVLGVCMALASVLLRPCGAEGLAVNIYGGSSVGKSTMASVAASVFGDKSYMRSARTSDNGLEGIAAQLSDLLLILDEMGEMDPKILGKAIYMLLNGQGKIRATRNIQLRASQSWLVNVLLTAEVTIGQHMAEAGQKPKAGQEIRMVDLSADAGAGYGLFESLHGHDRGAALSDHLKKASQVHYGVAGRAWIEWCSRHFDALPSQARTWVERFSDQCIPEAAGGQVGRVGKRFALIAAAGELASEAGITGWTAGVAMGGVRDCFNAWLASFGGLGNAEERHMIRQVRRFLELHGESRFHWWTRAADDRSPNTPNRAGFRRLIAEGGAEVATDSDHMREFGEAIDSRDGERSTTHFFVMREVFRAEVCEGFDPLAVARVLASRGHLVVDKSGRHDRKERLPGIGLTRCYRIQSSIFDDEGD